MSTCLVEKVFYTDQLFYTAVFSNYLPENSVLWFKNRDRCHSSFLDSLVHHGYSRIVIFTPPISSSTYPEPRKVLFIRFLIVMAKQ
jgi:hypothetical protein